MKLLNFLIEKRVTFMGLLLLFVCVTFVSGGMEFRDPYYGSPSTLPYISGYEYDTLLKRTEITTDKVEWPKGREIRVGIFARAYGVGIGEGTLKDLNVLGQETIPTYQDGPDDVWDKKVDEGKDKGSWKAGEDPVTTVYREEVPKDTVVKSYSWDSKGDVTLTPWGWEETVGNAVTIRWPVGIQGTFTTSGGWRLGNSSTTTNQGARKAEGHHVISHKYYCSVCGEEGDTPEAIGGKEKHKEVACPECGDKYHVCDKTAVHKHSKDPDTGKYRCDPLQISLNKTSFMVGEELVVSVERDDHYWVVMDIDDTYRASGNPESSGSSSSETRTTLTSSDVGDRTVAITVYYDDDGGMTIKKTTETFSISVEDAPSVSLNNWNFSTYDTLEVTVSKSDLYYVDFTINGDSVPGKYTSGDETSVTLSKGFDHDDAGYHQVAINIYWGENGKRSTTHYEYVLILDDR